MNVPFFRFATPTLCSSANTVQSCSMCFSPILEVMISFEYTKVNRHLTGYTMTYMVCWKPPGAFQSRNGMWENWWNPWREVNRVFSRSMFSISCNQRQSLSSRVRKTSTSPVVSIHGHCGHGVRLAHCHCIERSTIQASLNWSIVSRRKQSWGDWLCFGWFSTFNPNNLSIFEYLNPRSFGLAWYGTQFAGSFCSGGNSIRCFGSIFFFEMGVPRFWVLPLYANIYRNVRKFCRISVFFLLPIVSFSLSCGHLLMWLNLCLLIILILYSGLHFLQFVMMVPARHMRLSFLAAWSRLQSASCQELKQVFFRKLVTSIQMVYFLDLRTFHPLEAVLFSDWPSEFCWMGMNPLREVTTIKEDSVSAKDW